MSGRWDDEIKGRVCADCGARRDLFVIWSWWPPQDYRYGRTTARMFARAHCVGRHACAARVAKARERSRQRGSMLVLYEAPCPDAPPGCCRWCGDPIVLHDPSDHRRARREVHYGDEHEVGDHTCRKERNGSVTWDARVAVRWREREAHGVVACVDCGTVCEGRDPMSSVDAVPWEADHHVPLEDGGEHTLENLRCRCVPCHQAKTAWENAERARRKRSKVDMRPALF